MITTAANPSTGMGISQEKTVSVFPNPVNDFLNIQGGGEAIEQVILTDMQGKTLINKEVFGFENLKVNVNFLSSGMYTLKIKSSKKWFTFKILKQ